MLARLKSWGLGIAAFAVMVFFALMKKAQADAAETRADSAQRNAAAEAERTNRLIRAQQAAGQTMANGEEELKNELEKAHRGDRRHFESND